MLSVIVPAYNAEKRIYKCISSILNAIDAIDEIVVVNDGSIDATEEIVKAVKDTRVRLINQANAGVSAARNKGLEMARGSYISFVDADDEVSEQIFARLKNEICDNREVVITGYKMVDCHGNWLGSNLEALKELPSCINPKEMALDYFRYFHAGVINSCCGKLYPRDILKGLQFNKNLKMGEDASFNLTVFARCKKIKIVPSEDYLYFQSDVQNSKKLNESMNKMLCTHFADIDSFIKKYEGYQKERVCEGMGHCWSNTLCDYAYDYCNYSEVVTNIKEMLTMPWTQYINGRLELPLRKKGIIRLMANEHIELAITLIKIVKRIEKTL